MIWTVLATTAASGGVCCPAAPGRTRRGARPSAAAAPRARPCTCPCRRAWWSPRSTTRWRGAASAATASTCRDVPSRAHYTQRSAARAGGPGRSNARRGGGAEHGRGIVAPATARGDRAGPACVRTYCSPYRGAHRQWTYMTATDMGVIDWRLAARGGLPWQGQWPARLPAACVAVDGAAATAVHWATGVRTWCGRTGSLDVLAGPATRRWRRQGRKQPPPGVIFFLSRNSWHDFVPVINSCAVKSILATMPFLFFFSLRRFFS